MRYDESMKTSILSADDVRTALAALTLRQVDRLAELSGVPATTIYKIRRGETANPGIETVRKFMPHVQASLREVA
jgi:transcriptional regulator with XRE-family HTH domain